MANGEPISKSNTHSQSLTMNYSDTSAKQSSSTPPPVADLARVRGAPAAQMARNFKPPVQGAPVARTVNSHRSPPTTTPLALITEEKIVPCHPAGAPPPCLWMAEPTTGTQMSTKDSPSSNTQHTSNFHKATRLLLRMPTPPCRRPLNTTRLKRCSSTPGDDRRQQERTDAVAPTQVRHEAITNTARGETTCSRPLPPFTDARAAPTKIGRHTTKTPQLTMTATPTTTSTAIPATPRHTEPAPTYRLIRPHTITAQPASSRTRKVGWAHWLERR